MKYKVIKHFTDLQDGGYPYNVDDNYPREGLEVKEERVAELLGSDNKQGQPLIMEEAEEPGKEKKEPAAKKEPAKRGTKRTG